MARAILQNAIEADATPARRGLANVPAPAPRGALAAAEHLGAPADVARPCTAARAA